MAKLTKQEQREYINNNIKFGVQDRQRTAGKYANYKDEQFNSLVSGYRDAIQIHLSELKEMIINKFHSEEYAYYKDLDYSESRSNIRVLKTYINGLTYGLNAEYVKELLLSEDMTANNNTVRSFTIKFYLAFYDEINKVMKEALISIVGCEQ